MKSMKDNALESYLFGGNADFMELQYDNYLTNPESVDQNYRKYFDSLQDGNKQDVSHHDINLKFAYITQHPAASFSGVDDAQIRVWNLLNSYRRLGHLVASLDPLKRITSVRPQELTLDYYSLTSELETEFYTDPTKTSKLKLKEIVKQYEKIYCGNIGFEFAYITDAQQTNWFRNQIESRQYQLNSADKLKILERLTEAEGLERFLNTKYPGAKRFSLEGGEVLIPALDRLLSTCAKAKASEVHIGMAHRGRLNALVNIAGKPPAKIFAEFDGGYKFDKFVTSGDVKYHKGHKCQYMTQNGAINVEIAFNPSHLEVINPVLVGKVRAKQDKFGDDGKVIAVLIHGDSALIGLGTNQGILNMSQTRANSVGGVVHIVINNQVGFTTSDPRDTRSSQYCTDVMKMIEAPTIHVNGDDPESVLYAIDLALAYKFEFKRDVMIDLVCFRRYGHQETDDPTLTQPLMYRIIKNHPGILKLYSDKIIASGIITEEGASLLFENYRNGLKSGEHIREMKAIPLYDGIDLDKISKAKFDDKLASAISIELATKVTKVITTLPNADFQLHPTVKKVVDARVLMGSGERDLDFGMAETLAYGCILNDGVSIYLTGEDSGRGTFSHRHAVWHNVGRDDVHDVGYIPLKSLENKSTLSLYDSVLNEECVLGFNYGYSLEQLRNLVVWEAQYGDFANGAQVIIDQFIVSAEAKWGVLSNLVMILPHGYDGSGPEHSSARLERYLQLCAENNIQVVIPSTAAQMFHLLRRKTLGLWIKPTVILMSKKLLRLSQAMSNIKELYDGQFNFVIGDAATDIEKVKKVIVCAGQVYYDLIAARLEQQVAVIRVEQLYPFPGEYLKQEFTKYVNAKEFVWVQEEPLNQGAWSQIRDSLDACLSAKELRFRPLGRDTSAAPACGSMDIHQKQLTSLLAKVFG